MVIHLFAAQYVELKVVPVGLLTVMLTDPSAGSKWHVTNSKRIVTTRICNLDSPTLPLVIFLKSGQLFAEIYRFPRVSTMWVCGKERRNRGRRNTVTRTTEIGV